MVKKVLLTAEYEGEVLTKSIMEWSRIVGICSATIRTRYRSRQMGKRDLTDQEIVFGVRDKLEPTYLTATWNGKERTLTIVEWSRLTGIGDGSIRNRLKQREDFQKDYTDHQVIFGKRNRTRTGKQVVEYASDAFQKFCFKG